MRNDLHLVYSKIWGGGEQYVYNLCQEQKKHNTKSFILLDKKSHHLKDKFEKVAHVILINFSILSWPYTCTKICNLIEKYNINTINCHSGHLAPLSALIKSKVPTVKLLIYKHNARPGKKGIYHSWLQKKADFFICVSKLVYSLQIKSALPQYKNKYVLIYNGIDTSLFVDSKKNKSNDIYTIGYAGRIVENKGLITLLDAYKKLSSTNNYKLLIAGTGNDSFVNELHNKIKIEKIKNVHFLGQVNTMNDFYDSIDIFILPSIVPESFGLVLCEAMYKNVPVITTNSGAQEEIIQDHYNGLIVSPNAPDEIIHAVNELSSDNELSAKIIANAKKTVIQHFTIQKCVEQINDLF